MSKMIDLGRMEPAIDMPIASSKARKRTKEYPSVWIHGIELPIKPEDVGKTFRITGTVHVTGLEERIRENRKGRGKEYNLELRSIQIHNERDKLKKALKRNKR